MRDSRLQVQGFMVEDFGELTDNGGIVDISSMYHC
jgi:hypothetical protein